MWKLAITIHNHDFVTATENERNIIEQNNEDLIVCITRWP